MKLNDKINLIREELTKEIKPIDTHSILESAQIEARLELPKKKWLFNIRWQTTLTTLLILGILIPLAISLSINPTDDTDNSDASQIYESIEEVYAFVATSAVALVYSSDDIFSINATSIPDNNLLVSEELSNLNRLLVPIEIMLSYNNNFTTLKSDIPYYANKIEYNGLGLLGEVLYYKVYFNEYLTSETSSKIDCLVIVGDKEISLIGQTNFIDNKTILKMTYFIDQENPKDYIQVSKNLSDTFDSFDFLIVKDDLVIIKNKLTFNENKEKYAVLENVLSNNQSTIFKIYQSETNKFMVEYDISTILTPELEDNYNESIEESGNIDVIIDQDASFYHVYANSSSTSGNVFTFSKKK